MASGIMERNGKSSQETLGSDVKIIVVGEKKCGKSRFIEVFTQRLGNTSGRPYEAGFARVYQCLYEIDSEPRHIKIFEIIGGFDNLVDQLTKLHFDANGIVFLYAVDDPPSFQAITDKWMKTLEENRCWTNQPSILVGNKKDLREDRRVIQRLARNNRTPVTRQQGESLVKGKIMKYFDCSSIDENDSGVHDAFDFIVSHGLMDWKKDNEAFQNVLSLLQLGNLPGNV
ncbi:unnamed protein product [Larinioides sclopetarius]|uniref:Uncharacterized protein n=1 Tax=Larinioides sclopetarius TaxID=280406 RepID=A0AAV2AQE1_9ARAC